MIENKNLLIVIGGSRTFQVATRLVTVTRLDVDLFKIVCTQAKPKWFVDYDGPSRPIINGPQFQMYSIDKFIDGRWTSFDKEHLMCQLLCEKMNELEEIK